MGLMLIDNGFVFWGRSHCRADPTGSPRLGDVVQRKKKKKTDNVFRPRQTPVPATSVTWQHCQMVRGGTAVLIHSAPQYLRSCLQSRKTNDDNTNNILHTHTHSHYRFIVWTIFSQIILHTRLVSSQQQHRK